MLERPDLWHGKIYRAMAKHGVENFYVEEIEECNVEDLNEREAYWVEQYDSYRNGYNATFGGDGYVVDYHNDILPLWEQGLSITDIAEQIGSIGHTVSLHLQKHGITKEEIYQRGIQVICEKKTDRQPVHQYSMDGEYIASYDSIMQAAREVGCLYSGIAHASRKDGRYCAGYQWRRTKVDSVAPIKLLNHDKVVELWENGYFLTWIRDELHTTVPVIKKILYAHGFSDEDFSNRLSAQRVSNATKYENIYQYDMDGNYVKTYNSIREASIENNIVESSISSVLHGALKSAGGYQWRAFKVEKIESYKSQIKHPSAREVHQYALDGTYIRSYGTLKEAIRDFNISKNTNALVKAARGERDSWRGFQWSFALVERMPDITKAS